MAGQNNDHIRTQNGIQIQATLLSLAINAMRLDRISSITEGMTALAHDIEGLIRLLGWKDPASGTPKRAYLIVAVQPGQNAEPTPHPSIRDRLEKADQFQIGGGRRALARRKGVIPPTSTHTERTDQGANNTP